MTKVKDNTLKASQKLPKLSCEAVFLSDLHMGWSRSNCGDAALLLDQIKCKKLYLNGDIFDGWKLKKRWFWAEDHDLFLSAVLRKVDEGTKVYLIPGNHDEDLRNPALQRVIEKICQTYGFHFVPHAEHKTKNGQHLLVLHGDQFDDGFTRSISQTADKIYNGSLEKIRGLGRPKKVAQSRENAFSLSTYFRRMAKGGGIGLQKNNDAFIKHVISKLNSSDHHGVIIGHTHVPTIDKYHFSESDNAPRLRDHFFYANSGDWINNHTALIERHSGQLDIIRASDVLDLRYFENHNELKSENLIKMHPKTANLRRWLHKLWSPESLKNAPSQTGTSKKKRKNRFQKIFG